MRRLAIAGIALTVVAGIAVGAYWFLQQRATGSPEILRTDLVTRSVLEISVSASGRVTAKSTTPVLLSTAGSVDRVWVGLGEQVRAGQRLATLEAADLERVVRQAELALEQAELALATVAEPTSPEEIRVADTSLASAASALEVARLGRETARVDADALIVQAQRQREQAHIRFREARDGSDRERAEQALEQAEAEERIARLNAALTLEQAQAQWQIAYNGYVQAQMNLNTLRGGADEIAVRQRELQVEQAQLRLRQTRRAVEDATLTAPHRGVIAEIHILEGATVRVGEAAFTIVDLSEAYAVVRIDEIDIGALSVGLGAEFTLDAYPDAPLPAAVASIAPTATNLGGVIAYEVRLRITGTGQLRVLEGMTGTARIVTSEVREALLVPSWAVRVDQATAEAYCYRLVNGEIERAVVELGRRDEFYSEVLSGLSEGDEVALVTAQRSLFDLIPQGGPPGFRQ
jgi:HlyD family secretion protein